MRTATLAALFAIAPFGGAQFEHFSELHPGESTLGNLSYLFQGLPNGVAGVTFIYDKKQAMVREKSLSKLLDSAEPERQHLRDWAFFVATRFYVDKKMKTYLVLTRNDAQNLRTTLTYRVEPKKLSADDQLLRKALICYGLLEGGRQAALDEWKATAGQSKDPVAVNVRKLLQTVKVTDRIGDDWTWPSIWR